MRPFRIDNTRTMYDQTMFNNPNYEPYKDTFNFDTAMGMSKYH